MFGSRTIWKYKKLLQIVEIVVEIYPSSCTCRYIFLDKNLFSSITQFFLDLLLVQQLNLLIFLHVEIELKSKPAVYNVSFPMHIFPCKKLLSKYS